MIHQWFVCEPESRWLRLSRRFAPEMLPVPGDSVSVVPLEAPRLVPRLLSGRPAVALWSLENAACCGANLKQLGVFFRSRSTARTLHFVAVDPRLSRDARLALSAWGMVILDRPEQLSRSAELVRRFWRAG